MFPRAALCAYATQARRWFFILKSKHVYFLCFGQSVVLPAPSRPYLSSPQCSPSPLYMRDTKVYYGKDDMRSFVGYELKRRAAKGIASMSALAPEAEAAGELDDVSSSSTGASSAATATTAVATVAAAATSTAATTNAGEESTHHGKSVVYGVDGGNEGRSDSGSSSNGGNDSDSGSSSTPTSGSADDNASSINSQVHPTSQPPSVTEIFPDSTRSRNNSSGEYEEDDSNIEF